ncbi:Protein N-acetyltransferase, RimJ/RimL family [Nonlabens sp. Hel1_33_55]|uniref:GNAT family N-acetyltransferase n=1 Tax=Nonlabens sp. Hel1_33_55 TaxID=1336802 RepID=UPI000875D327|nr:GNAT family N-acetyltransferase [Nonlabens sp. Hel1_33_55]SCY40456.1 Protein N-acetyltransferase, RimJ/RimL family [Nonlabens sp. Hel1_33_55]
MNLHFETDRLFLRPFELSDAALFYQMNADEEVMRYTGDIPFNSIKAAEEFITDYIDNPGGQIQKYQMGRLAVIEKSSNEFLGFCGIKTHEATQITDIGYRLLRSHWGKGNATEACQEMLKFAFESHNKNQIIAHVHEQNIGSQRVAEKLGFSMDHRFLWDGILPGRYYKLTRDAYNH